MASKKVIQEGVVELSVDASGVEAGVAKTNKSLDSIKQKAKEAGKAGGEGFKEMASGANSAADKIDSTTKKIASSIERAIATAQAGKRGTSEFYEAIANIRGANADYLKPYINRLKDVEHGMNGVSKSTKEMNFSLRQVPAQFTDIVVSLQSGQKPMQVLLQQGGQLKDLFGGIGNATRALGSYVLSLVNPYTIAAAAVTGLGAAYFYGSQESTRLSQALVASGNIAGGTVGQFNALAERVGNITGKYGESREAMQALAAGGVLSGNVLEKALKGVVDGATVTGKSVDDLAKDFESLAKDPVKAIIKLNETQNFLTADIYKQITALQEQGRTQEAATLAINTYANTLAERKNTIVENLGYIEQAWKNIGNSAAGAIDAIKNVGREQTDDKRLEDAQKELKRLYGVRSTTQGGSFERVGTDQQIKEAIGNVTKLTGAINAKNQAAQKESAIANSNKQKTTALDFLNNAKYNSSNLTKEQARNAEIEKINNEFKPQLKAFSDDTDNFKRLDALRKQAIKNVNDKYDAPAIRASKQVEDKAKREREKAAREAAQVAEREQNAYNAASSQIQTKITAIKEELRFGTKLTESQKILIKLNSDEANGVGNLNKLSREKLKVKVEELSLQEEILKNAKLQDELTDFAKRETDSIKEKSKALEVEYALYGKADEAREMAIISIEQQHNAEAMLNKLREDGYTITQEIIEQQKREAEARATNEQSILGQSKALAYAKQLDEKHKEYELNAIIDAEERARREIEIEDEKWQLLIQQAGNGTQAQKVIMDSYAQYVQDRLNKPTIDKWKDTVKTYDDVFRNGFLAMLQKGKDGFSSWATSLKNTFKATVADKLYEMLAKPFVVKLVASLIGVGGTSGVANAANTASNILGGNESSVGSIINTLKDGFGGVQDSLIEGIAGFGTSLRGIGLDNLGTLIENNSTMLGNYLPYAGAALQLLNGNVKGAAFTAAGAAIGSIIPGVGTAIGGIVGNIVGGLFGSKKIPLVGSQASGTFADGKYTGTTAKFGSKDIGAQSSLESLNAAFASQLSGLLKSFSLNASVAVESVYRTRTNARGFFGATFDGASFYSQVYKDKSKRADFNKFVDAVLGTELVKAIQLSKLPQGIKNLFDGLSDKTQVSNMIAASGNLNLAQKQLADRFGLTVEQASNVAKTTGLAGDNLSSFANTLAQSALAFQSVGESLINTRNTLSDGLGGNLPTTLKAFDDMLKNIDKSTQAGIESFVEMYSLREQFSAFTLSIDGLKSGVNTAIYSIVSDTEKQKMLNSDLSKAFTDAGLSMPTSVEELIKLGREIDFTTESGLTLASVFPSLVDAFSKTQEAASNLVDELKGIDEFATLVDYNRYKAVANNYGSDFANGYTEKALVNNVDSAGANSIAPVTTNDPILSGSFDVLNQKIEALNGFIGQVINHVKRSADVLVNVSPNGDTLQIEAVA